MFHGTKNVAADTGVGHYGKWSEGPLLWSDWLVTKRAEKLKSREMKEGWMKNDERWKTNDEGWLNCFALEQSTETTWNDITTYLKTVLRSTILTPGSEIML